MFTPNALAVLACSALVIGGASAANAQGPDLGEVATSEQLAAWDISIGPDGVGLPPGRGTAAEGEVVYNTRCVACHGEKGAGKPNDRLVGGIGTLVGSQDPIKTVGSYWPYATTLFDYTRRAMPWNAPRSLTDEQVYAVTAYILNLNGIISVTDEINAQTLPRVQMPNRDGFIQIYPREP